MERNARTAKVVKRAEDWRFGSLWVREHGRDELRALLSAWPIDRPRNWIRQVNEPFTEKEQQAIQVSIARGRSYGDDAWQRRIVTKLGLEHTVRSEGRPRKPPETQADA